MTSNAVGNGKWTCPHGQHARQIAVAECGCERPSVKPRRFRRSPIRWAVDGLFGVDTWFFWKTKQKSKLLRARCLLLGGHRHEWKKLHGGGAGLDALICRRCHCHIAEYRETQSHE